MVEVILDYQSFCQTLGNKAGKYLRILLPAQANISGKWICWQVKANILSNIFQAQAKIFRQFEQLYPANIVLHFLPGPGNGGDCAFLNLSSDFLSAYVAYEWFFSKSHIGNYFRLILYCISWQAQAMVEIVKQLGWTYVSTVAAQVWLSILPSL